MTDVPTYQQVVECKQLTEIERLIDLEKLKLYEATDNRICRAGNAYIYHYMLDHIMRTRPKNHESLYDVYHKGSEGGTEKLAQEVLRRRGTLRPKDIFEVYRVNRGCVAVFAPSTAKYLYKLFGATSVLDPCSGWGGRMLAAHSLGIRYTGMDTNLSLQLPYHQMMSELSDPNLTMMWGDCLKQNFADVDYDLVLTSPPYVNVELYEHMKPWAGRKDYTDNFLIPLLNKCLAHCKGKYVCFNISPEMYEDLLKANYREANLKICFPQRIRMGKDKQHKIYVWFK